MVAISSAVASRSVASSPMTARRSAQWPTMVATFKPTLPSRRLRYSPKLLQSHTTPCSSASSGMPSTRTIMRRM